MRNAEKFMRELKPQHSGKHLYLGPSIQRRDLLAVAHQPGGYRFLDVRESSGEAVLQGSFGIARLVPGISIHTAAVTDLCSLRSETEVESGLKIVMVVDGLTELSYGHHQLALGPAGGRCSAVALALRGREAFSRNWARGRTERKLVISLSPEWLDNSFGADDSRFAERIRAFTGQHLALQEWQASPRAQMLAREVIALPALNHLPAGLHCAYQTARCLEIAIEALDAIGRRTTLPDTAQAHRQLLGRRLCEVLNTPEAAALSLAEIARRVGSNPVTLQEIAREALGMTVFEYLREQALQRARRALTQGQSVAAAAALAGYASQSNFATAFKRRFGLTPRALRAGSAA